MTRTELRNQLMDAYGRDRLTPVTVLACHEIADLIDDLIKPSDVETYLTTPAPAYNNVSLLRCVAAGDLDTPLTTLTALANGDYV